MRRDRTEKMRVLGVALASAVFLWVFRAIELSPDSLGYVFAVHGGEPDDLFYAPHLAYATVVHLFTAVLGRTGDCGVVCAGQVHSVLWGAAAVTCMYILVRRIADSRLVGLLAAAALLVSHGFWVYASQLEGYVPFAGALLALTTLVVLAEDRWPGVAYVLVSAAIWCLATLFHQANAIFAIPLIAYLGAKSGQRGARTAALICLLAGASVLLAYLLAYLAVDPHRPFVAWIFGLANTDLTDWGTFSNWDWAGFKQALYSQVSSLVVLPDEVRTSQLPLQWRGALAILAVLGWNLLYVLRRRPRFAARFLLLAWFFVYFLFFTWWDPRVLKFFIPSGVPFIALSGLALHDLVKAGDRFFEDSGHPGRPFRIATYSAAAVTLSVIFVFNLAGSILPIRGNLGPPMGPHYQEAQILDELSPAECEVIAYGHQLLYLSYYFDPATRTRRESIRELYQGYYDDVLSHEGTRDDPTAALQPEAPCALVNFAFLSEKFFRWRTRPAVQEATIIRRPPDWLEFLRWYFRVEPAEGDSISFDAVRFLPYPDHQPLMLVDRRRRQQEPGDYLAKTLAAYGEDFGQNPTSAYAGRDRTLIFGYSGNTNIREPGSLLGTVGDFLASPSRPRPPDAPPH